jgi:hypothetical protein
VNGPVSLILKTDRLPWKEKQLLLPWHPNSLILHLKKKKIKKK